MTPAKAQLTKHAKAQGLVRYLAPSDRILYTAVVDLYLSHGQHWSHYKGSFTASTVLYGRHVTWGYGQLCSQCMNACSASGGGIAPRQV